MGSSMLGTLRFHFILLFLGRFSYCNRRLCSPDKRGRKRNHLPGRRPLTMSAPWIILLRVRFRLLHRKQIHLRFPVAEKRERLAVRPDHTAKKSCPLCVNCMRSARRRHDQMLLNRGRSMSGVDTVYASPFPVARNLRSLCGAVSSCRQK